MTTSASSGMGGGAMDASIGRGPEAMGGAQASAAGNGEANGSPGGSAMSGGAMSGGAKSGGSGRASAMTPGQGGGGPGSPASGSYPDQPNRRSCGTMDVHRRLLIESEAYRQARAAIESLTLESLEGRTGPRFSGVVEIPVVVHVVYNTAQQNLSAAQVTSQIDVLNRDFRATNPDVSIVPAAFSGLISDTRIEFSLATTDPSGNPTDGITRTATAATSFSDNDGIKSSATGGADPWPADQYLNVWTAPRLTSPFGDLLGYAQFPGGPAATDGVVILHSAFGTTGTAAAPFHLGRTTTHEIGHYLNLFHIWGDDGSGCGGSDEVDDTPNQAGPNFGAPAFPHVSCSNGPNGDLFMDYMDYVDDAAMVMFTHGQAARMEACLDGVRPTLIKTKGRPTPAGPVVSWSANRIDAFVVGTDRAMYHKWWDGSGWEPSISDYEYMGGICMSEPEVASWGPNRLDAFVLGPDRALYHKWWDGSGWGPSLTGYENMGGVCIDGPRVASWGPNRLDAFVLGPDRALYHKWWDGSSWGPSLTGYEYMGGVCQKSPEVVAWGPNRLDVFVVGADSALYHKWWDGSSWGPSVTGWEYMGGVCASAPTAVAWGPDRLDVFVVGTDSALYHKWWDGSSWGPSVTDWEYMGGVCIGQPTVASWGPDRLDVFVVGSDSALHHKWWDGSSWGPSVTGWEYMGGICTSRPRVTAWGPNRLDVFVAGSDSALHHKWWDGSSWGPSLTGYESLGGVITEFRTPSGSEFAAGLAQYEPKAPEPVGAPTIELASAPKAAPKAESTSTTRRTRR